MRCAAFFLSFRDFIVRSLFIMLIFVAHKQKSHIKTFNYYRYERKGS